MILLIWCYLLYQFNKTHVGVTLACYISLYEILSSITGVSNSVSYAGHILTKEGLAGCIKRKNVSAGHNWRLKVPLYYKNGSFINNLNIFNDVVGRTNTSGGPHAARGPRVWDPCSIKSNVYLKTHFIILPQQWNLKNKCFLNGSFDFFFFKLDL